MTPVTQRCSFSTATQTKDCLGIGTPKSCIILSNQKMHFYFLDQEQGIKIIIYGIGKNLSALNIRVRQ